MNCPVCNYQLRESAHEGFYEGYPSFTCDFETATKPNHYRKYFSADWSYSRYEEYATLMPYRIVNYYDHRDERRHLGLIQEYKHVTILGKFGSDKFRTILSVDNVIAIPSKENFLNKIKTLLLFS